MIQWEINLEVTAKTNPEKAPPAPPYVPPKPVKISCGVCDGKGQITPLFNQYILRNCICCRGRGFHFERKPALPPAGRIIRFKQWVTNLILRSVFPRKKRK